MAFGFDTLGYAKRLRDAGIPGPEAEAHAEAAKEFIMSEVVTKSDLTIWRRELETAMENLELRLMAAIVAVRHDLTLAIEAMRHDLTLAIGGVRQNLTSAATEGDHTLAQSLTAYRAEADSRMQRLESRIDALEMRLTLRLGGMIPMAVAILAALIKF
jgi:hypothetical protein